MLVLPTFSVSQSWKMSVLPTFPTISVIFRTMALAHGVSRKSWKLLVLPTFPTISVIFPNDGSGSRGFPKIMEIVGFANIFREPIMENVGFTNISNNFHDCPNYGSGSWGFSKVLEIVIQGNVKTAETSNIYFYNCMRVTVRFGCVASSSDGLSRSPGLLVFREDSTRDSRIFPECWRFFVDYSWILGNPRTRNSLELLGIPGRSPAPIEHALAHSLSSRTN